MGRKQKLQLKERRQKVNEKKSLKRVPQPLREEGELDDELADYLANIEANASGEEDEDQAWSPQQLEAFARGKLSGEHDAGAFLDGMTDEGSDTTDSATDSNASSSTSSDADDDTEGATMSSSMPSTSGMLQFRGSTSRGHTSDGEGLTAGELAAMYPVQVAPRLNAQASGGGKRRGGSGRKKMIPGEKKRLRKEGIEAKRARHDGVEVLRVNQQLRELVLNDGDMEVFSAGKHGVKVLCKMAGCYGLKAKIQGSGKRKMVMVMQSSRSALPHGGQEQLLNKIMQQELSRQAIGLDENAPHQRRGSKGSSISLTLPQGPSQGPTAPPRGTRLAPVMFVSSGVLEDRGDILVTVPKGTQLTENAESEAATGVAAAVIGPADMQLAENGVATGAGSQAGAGLHPANASDAEMQFVVVDGLADAAAAQAAVEKAQPMSMSAALARLSVQQQAPNEGSSQPYAAMQGAQENDGTVGLPDQHAEVVVCRIGDRFAAQHTAGTTAAAEAVSCTCCEGICCHGLCSTCTAGSAVPPAASADAVEPQGPLQGPAGGPSEGPSCSPQTAFLLSQRQASASALKRAASGGDEVLAMGQGNGLVHVGASNAGRLLGLGMALGLGTDVFRQQTGNSPDTSPSILQPRPNAKQRRKDKKAQARAEVRNAAAPNASSAAPMMAPYAVGGSVANNRLAEAVHSRSFVQQTALQDSAGESSLAVTTKAVRALHIHSGGTVASTDADAGTAMPHVGLGFTGGPAGALSPALGLGTARGGLGLGFVAPRQQAPTQGPPQGPSSSQGADLGYFEKHTTGFGSRMLAKWGFKEGEGLGRKSDGRTEPIEANMRPKRLGLGA